MPSLNPPAMDPRSLRMAHRVGVDAFSGGAVVEIPLRLSAGRGGFGPKLALSYGSGAPNSAFGVGWSLVGPLSITVSPPPPALDGTDDYSFSAVGDLVPSLILDGEAWTPDVVDEGDFWVRRHRARIERGFLRIEQWTEKSTRRVHSATTPPATCPRSATPGPRAAGRRTSRSRRRRTARCPRWTRAVNR
jgi:virulence plasmid B protein